MRDIKNKLTSGKNTKNIKNRKGKSFGYQVLGFGAGLSGPEFIVATGGTITTSGNFKIHKFTGDGTFCVSAGSGDVAVVDYIVVAGGAGGGGSSLPNERGGGGGGAGGFRESPGSSTCYTASPLGASPAVALPVSIQGYPITVGGGGSAGGGGPGTQPANKGGNGQNSVFSTITSTGGGGGAIGGFPVPACKVTANTGGSGGGVGSTSGANRFGGAGNTPPTNPAQGQPGGGQRTDGDYLAGGGGGGATGSGSLVQNPPGGTSGPDYNGGSGGTGATTNITASPVTYSVGGKGGAWDGDNPNTDGGANTGTGGSGGGANLGTGPNGNPGNTGGSGVVILRYKFQ